MSTDATFWDNIAETYAAKPVERPDAFERKIEITRKHMQPRDVLLDIGCGTGSLALRLAPHGGEIHGLDLSSEMTKIARFKAEAQDVRNVLFHTGAFDESFTAFEDESLDGICAYSLLHLVNDRSATLARIYRLLKPGGFFISSTPCLGESRIPYRLILPLMRWLGKAPYVEIISKARLAADVVAAGFVDISTPDVGAAKQTAFTTAFKPKDG